MQSRYAIMSLLSFCLTLIFAGVSNAQTESSSTLQPPPHSKLVPVHLPDTSKLESEVRDQLKTFQASLTLTLNDRSVTQATLGEAYGTMGQIFQAYSLMLSASDCYVNANVIAPKDFRWVYLLGKIDQHEGHVDAAINRYLEARALRSDYIAVHVNLGNLFLQLDRLAEAAASFEAALALEKTNAAALYGLGQVALSRRRYAEAVRFFEQVLMQVPGANRVHYSLAMAYRGLGNLEQAKVHFAQRGTVGVRVADPLIDQLPELVAGERVHMIRGRMAFDAKSFTEAAAEFRKAIAAKPDSVTAHLNLGATLVQINDLPAAAAEFEMAVRLDPENITAHFNLSVLLAKANKHDLAIGHLQSLLSRNPDDLGARFFLAQELLKLDRLDEALVEFARVSRADPNNEQALLEEVKLLQQKKLYKQAIDRLASSYADFPHRVQTAVTLAYFLATSPQYDLRDGARALKLAQGVFRETGLPQHGAVVAIALAELGRCAEAADWQRKMIALAEQQHQPDLVPRLKSDLKLYDGMQMCRP